MKRQADFRDIRIGHTPLMTERVYGERFLKGLIDSGETLSDDVVAQKALDLLGLLEAYQRTEKTSEKNARFAREKDERRLVRAGERILAIQTPEDLLSLDLGQAPESDAENTPTLREHLTAKIRDLFSFPQVREYFLSHLRAEAERYADARPKLAAVDTMERAQDAAFRLMNRVYLESVKRPGNDGRLDAVAKEKIGAIAAMDRVACDREEAERASANESERGFLLTQRLLQYKQQYEKDRFVLTPSRQALVRRISEYVLAGKKVFLVGPTGTGKTQLALYVADATSGKYEVVSWHEGTTPRDLFGYRELWTDDAGRVQSGTKPGPIARAVSSGATAIHDEYTAGSTRSQIAAKYLMNARPGGRVQIPGFNGEIFEVGETFAEIYTGNLKDERTKDREDMDPAILRMLSGIAVGFMPEGEMRDIILSRLIESNGVVPFSRGEVALVGKIAKAAELMQLFHDRAFDDIRSSLPPNEFGALESIFGKIDDARLDKNFLDPGTLFGLFDGLDAARAKGGSLSSHLEERLANFLRDPKADTAPEERALAARILVLSGVFANARVERGVVSDIRISATSASGDPFILPSELAGVFGSVLSNENPLSPASPFVSPVEAPAAPRLAEGAISSFIMDMFRGWYAQNAGTPAVTRVYPTTSLSERAKEVLPGQYGEWSDDSDVPPNIDFTKARLRSAPLPDTITLPHGTQKSLNSCSVAEVMEYVRTAYPRQRLGMAYFKWVCEEERDAHAQNRTSRVPPEVSALLKDGNYHFFPGAAVRVHDGQWDVPCVYRDGSSLHRDALWFSGGWCLSYRVALLEIPGT